MTNCSVKSFIGLSGLLSSSAACAMTACPPQTIPGRPWLAWSVFFICLVIASRAAYILARRCFSNKTTAMRIVGLLTCAGIWLGIMYFGFLGWFYYMFTCF